MDWGRARFILLLTFTLVNLGLLAQVWRPGGPGPVSDMGLAAFELREVRSRLRQQGFDLEARVTPAGKVPPFLRLTSPPYALQEQVAAAWRRLGRETAGDGPVQILESGEVVFRPRQPLGPDVKLDNRGSLRQAADDFLRQSHLPELADLRWARTVPAGPARYLVEYNLYHSGYPVFAGYVRVFVGRHGVEEAVAFLPVAGEFRGEPRGVLSGTQALLRLAGQLSVDRPAPGGAPRRTFTDLQLGYYAPYPGKGAPAWEVVPVWRVNLDDREFYYVNALTGELEPR